MKRNKRQWLRATPLVLLMAFSGCHHSTPIKELAQQSDKYKDQDVRISGRVVASFTMPAAFGKGFYVVSDGTGQIGVVTQQASPPTNSEVTVSGKLSNVPAIALPAIQRFQIASVMLTEVERQVESKS